MRWVGYRRRPGRPKLPRPEAERPRVQQHRGLVVDGDEGEQVTRPRRQPGRGTLGASFPAASRGATNNFALRSQILALAPANANRNAIGSPSGKRQLPSWFTGARKPPHPRSPSPRRCRCSRCRRCRCRAVDRRPPEREQRPRRRRALHRWLRIGVVGGRDCVVDARAGPAGRDRRDGPRQLQHRRRRVAHVDSERLRPDLLPCLSVAAHLTSVLPSGKIDPDAWSQVIGIDPSTMSSVADVVFDDRSRPRVRTDLEVRHLARSRAASYRPP